MTCIRLGDLWWLISCGTTYSLFWSIRVFYVFWCSSEFLRKSSAQLLKTILSCALVTLLRSSTIDLVAISMDMRGFLRRVLLLYHGSRFSYMYCNLLILLFFLLLVKLLFFTKGSGHGRVLLETLATIFIFYPIYVSWISFFDADLWTHPHLKLSPAWKFEHNITFGHSLAIVIAIPTTNVSKCYCKTTVDSKLYLFANNYFGNKDCWLIVTLKK